MSKERPEREWCGQKGTAAHLPASYQTHRDPESVLLGAWWWEHPSGEVQRVPIIISPVSTISARCALPVSLASHIRTDLERESESLVYFLGSFY